MLAGRLHRIVAAHAPVIGVSIGQRSNKATWTIQFKPEATQLQRTAAQQALDAWQHDQEEAAEAARIAAIRADADTVDLLNKLASFSNTQIKNYIDNNVTNLATAKIAITKMALLLALLVRELD